MKALKMISWMIFVLAVIAFSFNTVICIVWSLHEWAVDDVPFKIALWNGVITWITVGVTSLVAIILSFIGIAVTIQK